ncbi:MAG: hypothetical protein LC798_17035 [Chloroflexi bacterium]|nr:hypothetical protein [Chloroflexota bacterium]
MADPAGASARDEAARRGWMVGSDIDRIEDQLLAEVNAEIGFTSGGLVDYPRAQCPPACNCPPGTRDRSLTVDLEEDPPDRTSPPSATVVGHFTGPNGERGLIFEEVEGEQVWGVSDA